METETLRHNDRPLLQTIAASLKAEPRVLKYGDQSCDRRQSSWSIERCLAGMLGCFSAFYIGPEKGFNRERTCALNAPESLPRSRGLPFYGSLLTDKGVLKHRRDVFYLTVDEVFGWVQATTVTVRLDQLVQLRKTEYAQWDKDGPPSDRFHTWGAVWHNNVLREIEGVGRRWNQRNASLSGLVEGIVLSRIEDPTQETLLPGELCCATAPILAGHRCFQMQRPSCGARVIVVSLMVARELGSQRSLPFQM